MLWRVSFIFGWGVFEERRDDANAMPLMIYGGVRSSGDVLATEELMFQARGDDFLFPGGTRWRRRCRDDGVQSRLSSTRRLLLHLWGR